MASTIIPDLMVNDALPVAGIKALTSERPEGDSGITSFTFAIELDRPATTVQTLVWNVSPRPGKSTVDGADFAGSPRWPATLEFAPGETRKTITVDVAGDDAVEPDEHFSVLLYGASAGLRIDSLHYGDIADAIILDDDGLTVSIAATDARKPEGNGGITPFIFTASLNQPSASSLTVDWSVVGSGARGAHFSDFEGRQFLPSGTLNFAPGETSKTITVRVLGDTTEDFMYPGFDPDEPDEQFTVTLSNPTAGLVLGARASAVGSILTDDSPAFVGAPRPVPENESYPFLLYYFGRYLEPGATTRYLSWSVSAAGDHPADATDFADGVFPSGSSTFGPGENVLLIWLPLANDAVVEPDETFTMTVSTVSAGVPLDSMVGTIVDDDTVSAAADAYVLQQGRSLSAVAPSAGVLANDENASTAALLDGPRHGTLRLDGDGGLGYTPAAGFFGVDSFSYRAGNAVTSADAEVLLYVVPVSAGESTTLDLLALSAEQQIAATYVAFFGRAADARGFAFWVGEFDRGLPVQGPAVLFANIASSFGVSDEAKGLYPFLADPFNADDGQIGSFLDRVYGNLFNRSSDADGRAYWTGQVKATLASGKFVGSVLIDIMGGAQDTAAGQDITTLMGKVAVSLAYVHEQQDHDMAWNGATDIAAATTLMRYVTANPRSVLIGILSAESQVAEHA